MIRKQTGIVLLGISALLFACTSSKKYDYFRQGLKNTEVSSLLPYTLRKAPAHVLDFGDVLEINYYTPDEINESLVNSADESEKKGKVNLFVVNSDGNIDVPLLGECRVKDMTVEQAKDSLTRKLAQFYNLSYIYIKLNSFSINVIGEVNKPGMVTIPNDQINILQALGMAGDISTYGNKKQVVLLRKENDKYRMFSFDLTDLNIVNSEAFFLKSNDIIYVKPLRSKNALNVLPFVSLGLTIINTILIIIQISTR